MYLENSLYQTDKFAELEPVIEQVKEDITFWGTRYVYLPGSSGRFPIDILARRVIELMEKTRFEYTEEERNAGKKIAAKIDQIYQDNDKKLKGKWFLTRFFCYLQDNFRERGYHPRFHWETCDENQNFNYYTASQYQATFNRMPSVDQKASTTHYNAYYKDLGTIVLYFPPEDRQNT
ncbi:hypothetical protein [Candidatus Protochlamydia amoebophila]|uniref:Uncharacterized protein n=1 Tax=Candidatus Protochlamydia amoebophila TaxID=362787 RepID=A0A0C1JQ88_9BACT|nr:hypothetical protein [Candidatus Protochlamydia amoebophila]KIC72681.1 hypothetical protein DB44_CC00030 [Candidatus Protochlamydia amoebophila]